MERNHQCSSNNYNGAISIEHEDGLMSGEEGFTKAVTFLRDKIIEKGAVEMWRV